MLTSQSTTETVFDLLANQRRRYLLYSLDHHSDTTATLDELTAQVVKWEEEWDEMTDQPADDRQRGVRVSLHHNHLPRIADAGLIEYDARSETVRNLDDPSLMAWAEKSREEIPHLRALFSTSTTE